MKITTASEHNLEIARISLDRNKEYDDLIAKIEEHIRNCRMSKVIVMLDFSSMEIADKIVATYKYYGWNVQLNIDNNNDVADIGTCCYIELNSSI